MATRFLPPKLLNNNSGNNNNLRLFTRSLIAPFSTSIAPVPQLDLPGKPESIFEKPPVLTEHAKPAPSSILDLNDHQKLFASLPSLKLLHAALTLHMAAARPVVDFGTWVMNSRVMETDNRIRDFVLGTIRHTFYEHFCAGEDTLQVGKCLQRVNEAGLRGMLDYAVEFTNDNHACDHNLERFLEAVQSAVSFPPSSVSTVVVKITALCPLNLLERISDLLRWQQKDPSFNLPWKHDCLPIFSDSSPLYHTPKQPEALTPDEENDLQLCEQRLLKICQRCVEANLSLTIDAEHTSVQPAIDYLTYLAALKHNKGDNPVVYGTLQAYLKDAKERLLLVTKAAEKMSVAMGFKLVRGAYMSSESKLASALGYESPIHNSIQETHACFNDCASFMLERIANGMDGVILATHNVESGRLAATKARELGIGKDDERLQFAQLYGMADALSFGLRSAGFQVSKYMPYGPVDMVMPYLIRRAEENRGLLSASSLDRELVRKELKRRLKTAFF